MNAMNNVLSSESWNEYLNSLHYKPEDIEARHQAQKFIDWCRNKNFNSLLFATQVYAASTGIVLKPQDFVPF